MRVTLKDVARRCGTSIHTVSKILTGHTHKFPLATRERVLDAVRDLGYRPNASARATRYGRFGQVGMLSGQGPASGNVPSALIAGIVDALQRHDLHLTLSRMPTDRLTDPGFVPSILKYLMVDGLIVNYQFAIPPMMADLLARSRLPQVWLNVRQTHDAVHPDDFAAGRALTEHLLRLGHRRIVYLDWSHKPGADGLTDDHYSVGDRRDGYRAAMRAAGFVPRDEERWVPGEDREAATVRLLRSDDRPTAVITYGIKALVPLWVAARGMGIQVPAQLSFASFEDEDTWALDDTPAKAYIPWRSVGQTAADILARKLSDPEPVRTVAVPMTIDPGRACPPPASVR